MYTYRIFSNKRPGSLFKDPKGAVYWGVYFLPLLGSIVNMQVKRRFKGCFIDRAFIKTRALIRKNTV